MLFVSRQLTASSTLQDYAIGVPVDDMGVILNRKWLAGGVFYGHPPLLSISDTEHAFLDSLRTNKTHFCYDALLLSYTYTARPWSNRIALSDLSGPFSSLDDRSSALQPTIWETSQKMHIIYVCPRAKLAAEAVCGFGWWVTPDPLRTIPEG
jgi:hypothetical protein